MKIYSLAFCLAGIATLVVLMALVSAHCISVSLNTYNRARVFLAVIIAAHAVVSVFRIATEVAFTRALAPTFVPELVGYLMFLVLFPPLWFFLEYLGVDHGVIDGAQIDLKRMKDYQDLAAKVWAAVVAVLVALISLRK